MPWSKQTIRPSIILASASPRRRELLRYIVDEFTCKSANIDETPLQNELACDLVERLAKKKAQFVAQKQIMTEKSGSCALVVGSDTVVVKSGDILGKPQDFNDFSRMMKKLSITSHQVYTGVCIVYEDRVVSEVVCTEVDMGLIDEQAILDYWASGEPQDKAGGYAIQGIGGKFVKTINGSFSAVVGLPLYETEQLIKKIMER